jgi:hypothetical protein
MLMTLYYCDGQFLQSGNNSLNVTCQLAQYIHHRRCFEVFARLAVMSDLVCNVTSYLGRFPMYAAATLVRLIRLW